ncbi:MAG TPA: hypothetical protein VHB68_15295 [Steroidobacteraceae bacterium]|nr:hypothetical protein [Steroidobacteraceae bacterium]
MRRRMAYPTAIGCGCLLGAGGASHVHAAEWTLQPTLSSLLDYDSNRNYVFGTAASEQAILSADLLLQRSVENLQLVLQPHFDVRRFSDSTWAPGNDRSLAAGITWTRERAKLNVNGSIANQTTLSTELLQTGILEGDSRRRSESATAELDLMQTEKRLFYTQYNFQSSPYFGPPLIHLLLPGYHYNSAVSGERFTLNENLVFSVAAFGDILHSERAGASSHEAGAQIELNYAHSEKLNFDVQLGDSQRVLSGASSNGWSAVALINRNFERSALTLSFSRQLTPYGNGYLVERQQFSAGLKRALSEYLNADLTVTRIQNNDSTVRLGLDRRFYDNLGGGLDWRLSESWTLRSEATTSWTPPYGSIHTVHEWRAALIMTWKPLQQELIR